METQVMTAPAAAGSSADYLERVRGVAPVINSAAEQIERDRRLTPELLDALHDAQLFRLLLPKRFGGGEVDPPTFVQTISAVAEHDASTAWCLCQANGCAMAAAYVDPAVADAIWGRDPRAVLAWGPGKAQAVPEDGGYRVTGNWSFASGMRHATWLGGHSTVTEPDGTPRQLADGRPAIRTMLFPAGEAEVTDIWDVIGLRGTASDAFSVADIFVPEEHTLVRESPAERKYDGPLYRIPITNLYASGFSGTAQGIARAMLDAFKELADEKAPRRMGHLLRDNALIQAEVARGEARLGSARAYLLSELNDIWEAVVARGEITAEERMRIRLATTYGIHEAKAVADAVYDAAGATAIFTGSTFERRFRDLHTVTQQIQGRKTHFQTVGAFLLGHPPDLSSA